MKKVLIASFAALVGAAAPLAHGQVTLASGQSGLIIGFDFANVPSSGTGSFQNNTFTNVGLYSDVGTGDDSFPGVFAPRGTLFMDGTHFSDAWTKSTTSFGGNVSTGDLLSNNEISSDLTFRHGVVGKSFNGFNGTNLGEIGGEAVGAVPKFLSIRTGGPVGGTVMNDISFAIDTTNFSGLSFSYGAKLNAAATTGSVAWRFTTDGVNFLNLGTDVLTTTDTQFSHNLSAFSQLNNLSGGVYVATFTSNANATQLNLDNFQWSGTFTMAEIPEPSIYGAILGAITLGIVAIRRRKDSIAIAA